MKKFMRGILCLLLALCMMMCFAACDEDEKEGKSIAGTYYFLEMTMDGETYYYVTNLQEVLFSFSMGLPSLQRR